MQTRLDAIMQVVKCKENPETYFFIIEAMTSVVAFSIHILNMGADVMTELQLAMLKKIAFNEYNQGSGYFPECANDTRTYADGIVETKQDQGVLVSLLNSGHVGYDGPTNFKGVTVDADIWLTKSGYIYLADIYEVGDRP